MVRISQNIRTTVKIGVSSSPSPPGPSPGPISPGPSSPGPSSPGSPSSKKSNSGLIVGITVGSIMGILISIMLYNRYRK
jgi:hypothetical protein